MKVSEELRFSSEVVASELDLLLLEMRSGFTKETALRNLALRTGVEDIESFCAMLIQADRFGTSISECCACCPTCCARGAGCARKSGPRRSR